MLNTIEKENFYSPEDLAKKFKISLSSIYKLIRSNELPHIRLGKVYRIPASNLQSYLSSKESPTLRSPISKGQVKIPEVTKNFIQFIEKSSLSKNVKEIYLFGSYARGDYHLQSDVDLLVILKSRDLKITQWLEDIAEKAMEKVDYEELLSFHIYSLDEWEKMISDKYPLSQSIQEEGILLWKNQ